MNPQPALASLYPFLDGPSPTGDALDAALLDSVRQKARDGRDTQQAFFERHGAAVVAMAHAIADVYRGGGRLFSMGNGGSSCDAAHIAVEFLHPVTAGRPALAAHDLGADTAMLTAVGNDVGMEQVFARQLIALARRGDGLVGVSTSGNSADLLAAFAAARNLGVATFGLAGHDGGAMARAELDHCLIVESTSIHRVQETHVAIYHVLWDLVHTLLADARGRVGTAP